MDVGILGGYVILGTICEKHFRNNNIDLEFFGTFLF